MGLLEDCKWSPAAGRLYSECQWMNANPAIKMLNEKVASAHHSKVSGVAWNDSIIKGASTNRRAVMVAHADRLRGR